METHELLRKRSTVSPGISDDTGQRVVQRQVRLWGHVQAELVERYLAGGFKKELARIYGVHVETVRAITARHVGPAHQPA